MVLRSIIYLLFISFSCMAQSCNNCEENKIAHVYYFWGQSNMASTANHDDWSDIIPIDGRLKIWNGSSFETQEPEPYAPPYTNNGIELAFSNGRLQSLHPDGDIFIIKRAVGSTSVAWHWNVITSTSGRGKQLTLYNQDITNALSLLDSQGYTVVNHRIISFIGETDSASPTSAGAFATNYLNTVNSIRATIGEPNLPITLYKIWIDENVQQSFPFPHVDQVRSNSDLLNGTNNINVIETKELERNDGIHLTVRAFNQLETKGF